MKARIPHWLERWVPILDWAPGYRAADLSGDAIAGLMVSIMLVPQAMAYAMLAGLPPQTGLYASLLPLVLYGIFGSSRTLAVGPVAIVSLLTASAIQRVAPEGGAAAVQAALTLAGLVGVMMVIMGVARLGVITHFLSHPVILGFTSAAATIIALSQLKHLLGVEVPASEHTHRIIMDLLQQGGNIQGATLAMGGGALILLIIMGKWLGPWLQNLGVRESLAKPLAQTGPLVVVGVATAIVWMWGLEEAPRLWRYSRADFTSFVATFVIVLLAGVELGVGIGAGTAIALYLWRSTRPHIAVLGRIGQSEHFRNIAAVKGPVMDRLECAGFPDHFGRNCIHLSLDEAMTAVGCAPGDLDEIPDQTPSESP